MRFELLPDCGHFIVEERPEELLDRLYDFMADHATSGRSLALKGATSHGVQ